MLLPVAGPQTIDAVTEIVNQHSPAGVIGVDTDIENSDLGSKVSTSSLNKGEKVECGYDSNGNQEYGYKYRLTFTK